MLEPSQEASVDHTLSKLIKQSVPLVTVLVVCLLILSIGAILTLGREVFIPVALAILLSFVVAPAVRLLQRLHAPHGLAVVVVVVTAFAAILALGFVFTSQLSGLAQDLPQYQETIAAKINALHSTLGASGTLDRAIGVIQELTKQVKELAQTHEPQSTSPAEGGRGHPISVTIQNTGSFFEIATGVLTPLVQPLAMTAIVLIFTIFVLSQREDLRNRFIKLVGTDDLQHTTAVLDDVARRLSGFFLTQLAVNASFGLIIGLGLWKIGVPRPVLWGIFAGILRFIPYVGAPTAALFPMILALGVDPGWSMLLWTIGLFLTVEMLAGNAVEPLLYGHSTGLSPVAIVLSATIWAFLWGPIGLVLATPLTVCLVALGRHVRQMEFFDILLGDTPALSPAEIFYQRMLAGDPSEAVLQAREFLKERALSTYYDEVALEGIRLAHSDIARGRISPERQLVLRESIIELIQHLDNVRDPRPRGGAVGAEAAAAVMAAGPDRAASMIVVTAEKLKPDWRGPFPVLCLAAAESLDETIARMIVQVLTKHGLPARAVDLTDDETFNRDDTAGVRMVCLSYVEPLSILHLRFAVRMARRQFPGVVALLGIWRQRDEKMIATLRQAARANVLVTTIDAALNAAFDAAGVNATEEPIRQKTLADHWGRYFPSALAGKPVK
jgi:predicted PurR-regulated permease PerM